MRNFPQPFHENPCDGGGSSAIILTGTGPSYSAPPLEGGRLTDNLLWSDGEDYVSLNGAIVSVLHFVLAEQSPGVVQILSLDDAYLLNAAPGDILRVRATVTDSLGASANFDSASVRVTMAVPEITAGPTFSASAGATSFNINFGSAGPTGTSLMLGAYTPTMTPIFTINGSDRVSELTPAGGSSYTRTGAAIAVSDIVTATASWNNIAGTTLSPTVTQTVSDFGFIDLGENRADLVVADGVDILLTVNGVNYLVAAADLAAMPYFLDAPEIAGNPEIGSVLTGTQGISIVNVSDPDSTFSWRKDGVATGDTDLSFTITATGSHVLRETIGAEFVDSNAIVVGAVGAWSLTPTGGGVVVNTIPARPVAPTIASVGAGSVTIG